MSLPGVFVSSSYPRHTIFCWLFRALLFWHIPPCLFSCTLWICRREVSKKLLFLQGTCFLCVFPLCLCPSCITPLPLFGNHPFSRRKVPESLLCFEGWRPVARSKSQKTCRAVAPPQYLRFPRSVEGGRRLYIRLSSHPVTSRQGQRCVRERTKHYRLSFVPVRST